MQSVMVFSDEMPDKASGGLQGAIDNKKPLPAMRVILVNSFLQFIVYTILYYVQLECRNKEFEREGKRKTCCTWKASNKNNLELN